MTSHVYRVTPVGHPPQTAVLKGCGQLSTTRSVAVQATVLVAPARSVVALPLQRAALCVGSDTHTRDENVETVGTNVASVVDHLE